MNSNTYRKAISKNKTWFTAIIFAIFLFMVMLPAHGYNSVYVRNSIQILKTDVINLNLGQGISNSLEAKLNAALGILNDSNYHNDNAAIHLLEGFRNTVLAQHGNNISITDADDLIAEAEMIILYLSGICPYCGGDPCIPPCDGTPGGGGEF